MSSTMIPTSSTCPIIACEWSIAAFLASIKRVLASSY